MNSSIPFQIKLQPRKAGARVVLPLELVRVQWQIQDFPNGGALFCRKWGGAHPVFR